MTARSLHDLAEGVGLSARWSDYNGQVQTVSDDSLRRLLAALDRPADSPGELAESLERADAERKARPPLVTSVRRRRVRLSGEMGPAALVLESGERRDVRLSEEGRGQVSLRAPNEIGYHELYWGDSRTVLAVAPERAFRPADLAGGRQTWGVAVQLYSLNDGGDFGDFGDLAAFCERLAAFGADAVAVSPIHALFAADPGRYAPYGPSTRLFLNGLYAATPEVRRPTTAPLIDWSRAAGSKTAELRTLYAAFRADGEGRNAFQAFVRDGGPSLLAHARFEALDARFRPEGVGHWRDWPDGYGDVGDPVVGAMAADDPEVEYHLFLQWRADASLSAVQAAARNGGMPIGLITDLAVGMDGGGSHAWSRPGDVLQGLGIGAPPDLLARQGQSWGLTTFSPTALRAQGFGPFLSTLRAALRHAGGVRIDHVIGLQRLWLHPDGEPASEGAYLAYPLEDLLRLIALESHRHRAIVIGEDLGTVPQGFRQKSRRAGVEGMRVLWFEQTRRGDFRPPRRWDAEAVAMTTTHDLPTVAGWWRGCDIAWREQVGHEPDAPAARAARTTERGRLWKAMVSSGAAAGVQPATDQPDPVVDAAVAHVAASACDLALIAVEDILGTSEQPNLPGTIDQHPNWRRRLAPGNGLDDDRAAARLRRLSAIRPRRT